MSDESREEVPPPETPDPPMSGPIPELDALGVRYHMEYGPARARFVDNVCIPWSPAQWVGVLHREGQWLGTCCGTISAIRDSLMQLLADGGWVTAKNLSEIIELMKSHDGFMDWFEPGFTPDGDSLTNPLYLLVQVWDVVKDRRWAGDVVTWCGSGSETKHLPPWAVQLSARQVDLLLDVMVAGDGSDRPHSRIYHTSSKRLADDVQAMCVSAGIVSQVWGPYGDADATPMYQVYVGQRQEAVTACFREEGSNHVTVEDVQGGRIVCFTVPNEILVTRRGGQVAIQGNTKHAMHLVRLLRMCREILTTGKVIVLRPDAEDLLGIRAGMWSYDALAEWTVTQDREMDALYESSKLPHSPNVKALDHLCMSLVDTML